jgi:hypothetical protein
MLGMGRETEIKDAITGGVKKGFSWVRDTLGV